MAEDQDHALIETTPHDRGRAFDVGDPVRLAPGTLVWSRHGDLREASGRVIAVQSLSGLGPRLTVEFDDGERLVGMMPADFVRDTRRRP